MSITFDNGVQVQTENGSWSAVERSDNSCFVIVQVGSRAADIPSVRMIIPLPNVFAADKIAMEFLEREIHEALLDLHEYAVEKLNTLESSNGRNTDSESVSVGSNPASRADSQ